MLNFQAVLEALGGNAAIFRIANAARSGADYLLASLLPEITRADYKAESGTMSVKTTMAGLVGMDSPYPPGGMIQASTFMEETAKVANSIRMNEKAIRELQRLQQSLQLSGGSSKEALTQEVLNFLDLVVLQAHLDTAEWLRAQALFTGAISWTFGKVKLSVDYGFPSANLLATRTTGSGQAYDGASSVFWSDVREARRLLNGNLRALITNSTTLDAIIYNPANGLRVASDTGVGAIRTVTLRRLAQDASGDPIPGQDSDDARDTVAIIAYDREGEIVNPSDPETTVGIPFVPNGKVLAVANNQASGYVVGMGSQEEDPTDGNRIGYTHLAPTVEGNGVPGRWARLYTPENQQYNLIGEGVTNLLPVIEDVDKVVVLSTELS